MRSRLLTSCLTIAVLWGCGSGGGSNTKPVSLSVTPSGTVNVAGSQLFTATVVNTGAPVTWALAGPGSLSGTTGNEIVYRAPPTIGATNTAVLTASAADVTTTVNLTLGTPPVPGSKIAGLTAPVTVQYDAYDIPHVTCATSKDCFAVQGYLHAHDRLFQMDLLRRIGRGRLATLVGPLGLSQDTQLRTLFTTRDGMRLEDALSAALDPVTGAIANAYVNGVNARLAELRADATIPLPGEYAQLPYTITAADIPDWTVKDIFGLARLQQFQLSESLGDEQNFGKIALAFASDPNSDLFDPGKYNAYVRAAAPAGQQAHTLPGRSPGTGPSGDAQLKPGIDGESLAQWRTAIDAATRDFAELRAALKPALGENPGSNNWVVDAAHSANGHAMVANDPHLSLQYPPNFHLVTLTSTNPADGLDVAGGAFPGVPGALVGRGMHVGWGVTVVGYDVTDLYLEQLVNHANGCPVADFAGILPGCALVTVPATTLVPIGIYPQSYQVRVGPGSAGLVDAVAAGLLKPAEALVVVVPQHGPLVAAPDSKGKAVSVRWTGHESATQDLKAFLGLITAADVAGAMTALKDYATGAQNFVVADDKGVIGYDPHALVPVRNFADARVTAPAKLQPPWLPLKGDGSAEWGSGNAADNCAGTGANQPAAACWIPDAQLPHATGSAKGYLATANADPLGTTDDNSPLAHPPYLSFDWDDSTGFRVSRISALLDAALKAGNGKLALADLMAVQADHYSTIGQAFAPFIAVVPAGHSADFDAAAAMLKSWSYQCPTGILGIDPVNSPNDPDAQHTADSASCFLFHEFLRTLLNNVFSDDLALAGVGIGPVQAIKGMLYMLDPSTPAGDTTFCNNVDTKGNVIASHSCEDQVVIALVTAYDTLKAAKGDPTNWRWGRVHTVQPNSQFPLVTTGYQPGPYARPGGAFTVDVGSPSLGGKGFDFGTGSSGNVRHISIMDPAAPVVKMQLPGPERDVVYGTFASTPDLLKQWVQNQYFDFAYSGQINGQAVSAQTFTP